MNGKIKALSFLLAVIFSLACVAPFAYAAESKLASLDLAYIFDNYNKTKDQDKILEQQTKQKTEERQRLVNGLRKMKDEMDVLSQEAKEKKQAELDAKIKELQEYDQSAKLELGQVRDKVIREILKEIETTTEKYATDNGYTLIFNSNAAAPLPYRILVYGQKQLDITNAVLGILNSKYKK